MHFFQTIKANFATFLKYRLYGTAVLHKTTVLYIIYTSHIVIANT